MFNINSQKLEYTNEDLEKVQFFSAKLTSIANQLKIPREYIILPVLWWLGVELPITKWVTIMYLKSHPINWRKELCNTNIDKRICDLIINSQQFMYDNPLWRN